MIICDKCKQPRDNIKVWCVGTIGTNYDKVQKHDLCPDCAEKLLEASHKFCTKEEPDNPKTYAVVRVDADTEKFSDIEGLYPDQKTAESCIRIEKMKSYCYRYEWKIIELASWNSPEMK